MGAQCAACLLDRALRVCAVGGWHCVRPLITSHANDNGNDNVMHTGMVTWQVGSPNCTATFHYDTDHNVFVQIYGKKRWIIMSPVMPGRASQLPPC